MSIYPEGLSFTDMSGGEYLAVQELVAGIEAASVCVSAVRKELDVKAASLVAAVFPELMEGVISSDDVCVAYPPFSPALYVCPLDEALGSLCDEMLRDVQDGDLEGAIAVSQVNRTDYIRLGAATARVAGIVRSNWKRQQNEAI